ncbi:MAG TPA: hypothetical protein VGF28_27310 [Thermoanaerobaculia bacterium]
MPPRETGSVDRTETYPHEEFLNDDIEAERTKRSRFISERFVLPRIRKNWNERDDAAPPTDAELESMRTMTPARIVDRALAKSVWVRAAITNMHEMRDASRFPTSGEEPDERAARRYQRKIEYWTAEREAVDHGLSAVINTRAQVLAAAEPRRRTSGQRRP